ncbi:NUDIX domain-containing protein [Methylobacterium sp. Leaf125]|uniref:NUDIX domain-containing protein n=1 Tax=Methylobacterium sp. Leaf125 TaxID=1736265 RepID=UPI0009E9633C|nr:NUDIX domain-containing protein [Methylobacterium sp. Leaf125]
MSEVIRQRRSARAILLDSTDNVLLIRFEVQRTSGPFTFWATPGGSVEDGETDAEAAQRELIEELHLEVALEGPIHVVASQFEHESAFVDNTDIFFLGKCERSAPRLDALTDSERTAMREIRWWSVADIENAAELIFPEDLASLIKAATSQSS